MAFTPRRLPSVPDVSRIPDKTIRDALQAIRTILQARTLGVLGQMDTVVLRGELGVSVDSFEIVTNVRMNGGSLQKKTRTITLKDGLAEIVGEESDWSST